jgi:molybdate-binding protein/predicted nucleic acid-binding protein
MNKNMMMSSKDLEMSSSTKLLLDTAFCLALIGRRPAGLAAALTAYQPGEIAISSLSVAALFGRAQRSQQPQQNLRALEHFLLPLRVVDFDAEAARALGQIAGAWMGSSDADGMHMQMLAAQARRLNATLVTSQPARYAAVPGLRVNDAAAVALTRLMPAEPPRLAASSPRSLFHAGTGVILAMGSHDLTLDLLGDWLHNEHPERTLVSAHVGSMGGLLALQRDEAHLAGSHLLDAETGDYNISFIRHILTPFGRKVVLLGFVNRIQGLIVARGNPKRISAIEDLLRDDVTFVNRQPGAGTRVLLDHELSRRGILPQHLQGYERTESSHLTVATAVASGVADCGLGIQAAAHTHDLDFVPLFSERFDLVIPADLFTSALLAPLLILLAHPSPDFLRRVAALGGYEINNMGRVLAEL